MWVIYEPRTISIHFHSCRLINYVYVISTNENLYNHLNGSFNNLYNTLGVPTEKKALTNSHQICRKNTPNKPIYKTLKICYSDQLCASPYTDNCTNGSNSIVDILEFRKFQTFLYNILYFSWDFEHVEDISAFVIPPSHLQTYPHLYLCYPPQQLPHRSTHLWNGLARWHHNLSDCVKVISEMYEVTNASRKQFHSTNIA